MKDFASLMRLQRQLRLLPQVSIAVRSFQTSTCASQSGSQQSNLIFPAVSFLPGLWTRIASPHHALPGSAFAAPLIISGFASTTSGNAAPPVPTPPPPPPPVSSPPPPPPAARPRPLHPPVSPTSGAAAAASTAGVESAGGSEIPPSGPQSPLWRAFKLALGLTATAAVGAAGYATYAYELDEMEKKVDELRQWKEETSGPEQVLANASTTLAEQYLEARRNIEQQIQGFSRPSSEKLLPDLRPGEQQQVYTLVLDLNDTLVHSDWKRERGWRTFKRPGATEFLEQLAPYYEIVVFSDQLNLYVDPIMDRLDPKGCVRYRLYRDATHYTHGRHVRDLSKLNRDLSHVIFVTGNGVEECTQAENVLRITPWKMDQSDTALLDHLPFLEFFARQRPPDARAVLKSYEGQDVPSAFRERTKEYKRRLMERKRPRLLPGWGSSQS